MIISHRHRFIFIKTNKTAGTSVEIALSRDGGESDVITPISPEDEAIRMSLGYPGPRNFLGAPVPARADVSAEGGGDHGVRFYNHMSAVEVKAEVGPAVWDSYYKFCFERNPWDRAISLYYWLHPVSPRPDLKDFLRSAELLRLKEKGWRLYTQAGQVLVDRVCRFEALAWELKQVCEVLGLPDLDPLPKAKSRFRSDRRPYQAVMDDADRDRVAEVFADEIKLMGYEF